MGMFNVKFVSQQGLDNLKTYAYHGVDKSLCARLFLNDFWTWFVTLVPMWIAPNILTLCGGFCILVATCLTAFSAPTFTEPLPAWVLIAASVLIFLYQLADNIDGKQAKRTKAGSPLGELFDHGLDSLVMGAVTMIIGAALRAGPIITCACCVVIMMPFYLSHWEEYHAGILVMGELSGPTELQIALIGLLLGTAGFGSDCMIRPFFGTTIGTAILVLVTAGALVTSLVSARHVRQLVQSGEAVTKASLTLAFRQPVSYMVYTALGVAWALTSTDAVRIHPQAFLTAITLLFGYLSQRLIVQRICKEPIAPMYPALVPLLIAVCNGAVRNFLGVTSLTVDTYYALLFMLAVSFCQEAIFVVSIINQLTTFLHIRAFVIPYPPPK